MKSILRELLKEKADIDIQNSVLKDENFKLVIKTREIENIESIGLQIKLLDQSSTGRKMLTRILSNLKSINNEKSKNGTNDSKRIAKRFGKFKI